MKFSHLLIKEEQKMYLEICFKVWGNAPVEVDWAIGTMLFKNEFENKPAVAKYRNTNFSSKLLFSELIPNPKYNK